MEHPRNRNGFTLVELLVALMVSSIILTAAATLAYSLGKLNSSSGDSARVQAQVRYVMLRLTDLVKQSRLICSMPAGDLALWRADDNGNNQININELIYIDKGAGSDRLRICEFTSAGNSQINLCDIDTLASQWWQGFGASPVYTTMIPQCSNVEFLTKPDNVEVPYRRFVSISFDIIENEATRHYQINAALRCWAGHLLNDSGDAVESDDD